MFRPSPSLQIETPLASAETSRLAQAAIGADVLPEAYFRWLGETGYGEPAIQIGAYEGEAKIGHAAISPQDAAHAGAAIRVGHVIDLFIDPAHRSVMTVQALYRKVMAELKARGFDAAAAVPNADATQIDRFFLKVKPLAPLPITMIPATPFGAAARILSAEPGALAPFVERLPASGTAWTPLTLASRLSRPGRDYVLATNGEALCIASPRRFKGVPMALICGVFARPGAEPAPQRMRRLVADAAGLCGQWAAVYVGRNDLPGMPPGFAMPDVFRPSPMVPHMHALTAAGEGNDPARFEAVDFDIA
jgi:hypothetical protein